MKLETDPEIKITPEGVTANIADMVRTSERDLMLAGENIGSATWKILLGGSAVGIGGLDLIYNSGLVRNAADLAVIGAGALSVYYASRNIREAIYRLTFGIGTFRLTAADREPLLTYLLNKSSKDQKS